MNTITLKLALRRPAFALDVNVELSLDGVLGVLGPSGSGKTTLLRCIAGLEAPSVGHVAVNTETWQDGRRFVAPHRRGVGYVSQDAQLFDHLDVRGNLEYGWRRRSGDEAVLARVIGLLGLPELLTRSVRHLSGGERRRVAIGRALVAAPRILLLDEPTANLDRSARAELLAYLERAQRDVAIPIILVSHGIDDVARLADQVLLLNGGRVSGHGQLHDVLTRLDLPPAHDPGAEGIVDAQVIGHDTTYHLTTLAFAGGELLVPHEDLAAGTAVRVRIAARDVSLTLARPAGTSILNILPARITGLAEAGPAQNLVRLECGGIPLLARITRKSVHALGLEVGHRVFAQVKSVALAR